MSPLSIIISLSLQSVFHTCFLIFVSDLHITPVKQVDQELFYYNHPADKETKTQRTYMLLFQSENYLSSSHLTQKHICCHFRELTGTMLKTMPHNSLVFPFEPVGALSLLIFANTVFLIKQIKDYFPYNLCTVPGTLPTGL